MSDIVERLRANMDDEAAWRGGAACTDDDGTLLLLNEAISMCRKEGVAGQHISAMCSARDEITRLRAALNQTYRRGQEDMRKDVIKATQHLRKQWRTGYAQRVGVAYAEAIISDIRALPIQEAPHE
jgi:hypothetical protein